MSKNKMNWKEESSKSGGGVDIVPDGSYKVEITGWQECEAKSTGTPQIRWFATVQVPEEQKGKRLCDHTALTSSALWRLAKLVGACGVDVSEAPETEIMSEAFKKVLDKCTHRKTWWTVTYNDQYSNNKVVDYIPVDQAEQEPIHVGKDNVSTSDEACPF